MQAVTTLGTALRRGSVMLTRFHVSNPQNIALTRNAELYFKNTENPIASITTSPPFFFGTTDYGKEVGVQIKNDDGDKFARVNMSASVSTVPLGTTGYQVPVNLKVQGGGEIGFKGYEDPEGNVRQRTVGAGVEADIMSLLQKFSPRGSYEDLNLRTGKGGRVEASIGDSMLPSLTVSDSTVEDLWKRFAFETDLGRQLIAENRLQNMDGIHTTAMLNGVSPITGEGLDEVASIEMLDHTFNVRPGARSAMEERNQRYGENFQNPLPETSINQGQTESWGQMFTRLKDQFLYGTQGNVGASQSATPEEPDVSAKQDTGETLGKKEEAPRQKQGNTTGDAPTKVEQESHEQDGERVEGERQDGNDQGHDLDMPVVLHTPTVYVDDRRKKKQGEGEQEITENAEEQELEEGIQAEKPAHESVREKMGLGPSKKGSQDLSQGNGTSVRDSYKPDSGAQKPSTQKRGVS